MKLSNRTVSILKNFATINPSLVVEPGNILRTVSPVRSVVARAEVSESFPVPFAIYNLSQFLSAASIGVDPDFEFTDKSVTISSGAMSVSYWYANPDLIKVKAADVTLPSEDVKFTLPADAIKNAMHGASTLSLPSIFLEGGADGIFIGAGDVSHDSSNSLKINIDAAPQAHTFKTIFAVENIRVTPNDYQVTICQKGVVKFHHEDSPGRTLTYYVASSKDSTFA